MAQPGRKVLDPGDERRIRFDERGARDLELPAYLLDPCLQDTGPLLRRPERGSELFFRRRRIEVGGSLDDLQHRLRAARRSARLRVVPRHRHPAYRQQAGRR
jgi:hypothetical protein